MKSSYRRKQPHPASRIERNLPLVTTVINSDENFVKKGNCKKRLYPDDEIDRLKKKAHMDDKMGVSPLPGINPSQSATILELQDYLLNSYKVI